MKQTLNKIDLEKIDGYAYNQESCDFVSSSAVSYFLLGYLNGVAYASIRLYGYYRESINSVIAPYCKL